LYRDLHLEVDLGYVLLLLKIRNYKSREIKLNSVGCVQFHCEIWLKICIADSDSIHLLIRTSEIQFLSTDMIFLSLHFREKLWRKKDAFSTLRDEPKEVSAVQSQFTDEPSFSGRISYQKLNV